MKDTVLTRYSRSYSTHYSSPALSPAQARADSLVSSFVDHATDGYSLAGMVGGGLVYRLGRMGTLALGSRLLTSYASPLAPHLLRLTSVGVGFTGEVFTFEAGQRVLRVGIGGADPNLLRWSGENGLGRGLVGAAITLGSLKGTGAFVNGQNPVLQHLFQDSAMVLAHNVHDRIFSSRGTLQRAPTLAEQFVEAEATLWQMNAGMALVYGAAPGLGQMERSLDLSIRSRNVGALREAPLQFNESLLAPAGPRFLSHHLMAMSSPRPGEGGSEGSGEAHSIRDLELRYLGKVPPIFHGGDFIDAFLGMAPPKRLAFALEVARFLPGKNWSEMERAHHYLLAFLKKDRLLWPEGGRATAEGRRALLNELLPRFLGPFPQYSAKIQTAARDFLSGLIALAVSDTESSDVSRLFQRFYPDAPPYVPLSAEKGELPQITEWQERLIESLDRYGPPEDLKTFSVPLRQVVPLHFLGGRARKSYPERVNQIRQGMLLMLTAMEWRPGMAPTPEMLRAILTDYEQGPHLPILSSSSPSGISFLLDGHHRVAALISLVADGYLPREILENVPLMRAENVDPMELIHHVFPYRRTLPDFGWSQVMAFHPSSAALLRETGIDTGLRQIISQTEP